MTEVVVFRQTVSPTSASPQAELMASRKPTRQLTLPSPGLSPWRQVASAIEEGYSTQVNLVTFMP